MIDNTPICKAYIVKFVISLTSLLDFVALKVFMGLQVYFIDGLQCDYGYVGFNQ